MWEVGVAHCGTYVGPAAVLVSHTGLHVSAAAVEKQALWGPRDNEAMKQSSGASPATLEACSLMTPHDGKTILRSSLVKRSKPIIPTF